MGHFQEFVDSERLQADKLVSREAGAGDKIPPLPSEEAPFSNLPCDTEIPRAMIDQYCGPAAGRDNA